MVQVVGRVQTRCVDGYTKRSVKLPERFIGERRNWDDVPFSNVLPESVDKAHGELKMQTGTDKTE